MRRSISPPGSFTVDITVPVPTGDQIVLLGSSAFAVAGPSLLYNGDLVGTITGLGTGFGLGHRPDRDRHPDGGQSADPRVRLPEHVAGSGRRAARRDLRVPRRRQHRQRRRSLPTASPRPSTSPRSTTRRSTPRRPEPSWRPRTPIIVFSAANGQCDHRFRRQFGNHRPRTSAQPCTLTVAAAAGGSPTWAAAPPTPCTLTGTIAEIQITLAAPQQHHLPPRRRRRRHPHDHHQ